jgi:hypothetical protein
MTAFFLFSMGICGLLTGKYLHIKNDTFKNHYMRISFLGKIFLSFLVFLLGILCQDPISIASVLQFEVPSKLNQ